MRKYLFFAFFSSLFNTTFKKRCFQHSLNGKLNRNSEILQYHEYFNFSVSFVKFFFKLHFCEHRLLDHTVILLMNVFHYVQIHTYGKFKTLYLHLQQI